MDAILEFMRFIFKLIFLIFFIDNLCFFLDDYDSSDLLQPVYNKEYLKNMGFSCCVYYLLITL